MPSYRPQKQYKTVPATKGYYKLDPTTGANVPVQGTPAHAAPGGNTGDLSTKPAWADLQTQQQSQVDADWQQRLKGQANDVLWGSYMQADKGPGLYQEATAKGLANMRHMAGQAVGATYGQVGGMATGGAQAAGMRQGAMDWGVKEADYSAQRAMGFSDAQQQSNAQKLYALQGMQDLGSTTQDANALTKDMQATVLGITSSASKTPKGMASAQRAIEETAKYLPPGAVRDYWMDFARKIGTGEIPL